MSVKTLATLTKTSHVKELNASLEKLKGAIVYVGIARGSKGDGRSDGAPDNHLLGFIHERGSPASNIPSRPFLVPGVKSARGEVADRLAGAIKSALHDDEKGMNDALERAGFEAVSGVKDYMTTAKFAPLKPATIRNRHRSRSTLSKRDNEVANVNIKPLINTGALRDAIDFYVKED